MFSCIRDGPPEYFKMAGKLEFGWKENAYVAYPRLYEMLTASGRNASDEGVARVLQETMPYIVHVRDQGGHAWEKVLIE